MRKNKTVNIRGKIKELVWVEQQGSWPAHYELDGEQFDGHFTLWAFSFEPHTYLKESELSGEEWRKGGSIKIFRDGVCVMEEFHREPASAPIRINNLLNDCMDVDWEKCVAGQKLYYKDHPCTIERVLDNGELILATENGEDFPLWAFQKENKDEADNRDWTNTTKVHAADKNIYWWRKTPNG